jgi:hypothetical protein
VATKLTTRITEIITVTPVGGIIYRVKQVLTALAVLLAVYATWIVAPVFMAQYRFEEAIQATARESAYNDHEEYQIHDEVMQKAREFGVPVKEENVVVTRGENMVRIEAKYEVPIKLPRGRLMTLTFSPSDSEKTLSHAAIQAQKAKEGK